MQLVAMYVATNETGNSARQPKLLANVIIIYIAAVVPEDEMYRDAAIVRPLKGSVNLFVSSVACAKRPYRMCITESRLAC